MLLLSAICKEIRSPCTTGTACAEFESEQESSDLSAMFAVSVIVQLRFCATSFLKTVTGRVSAMVGVFGFPDEASPAVEVSPTTDRDLIVQALGAVLKATAEEDQNKLPPIGLKNNVPCA